MKKLILLFSVAVVLPFGLARAATVTTYDELVASLANDESTEIPTGTEIVVPGGSAVAVAEGKTLLVNGTLWIEGNFSNSGTVTIGGTLSKLYKAYVQKGQDDKTGADAEPKNPYADKKYWVTSVETFTAPTVSGVTPSTHVRITNGKGTVYRAVLSVASPVAIICAVDPSVAINHITGITDTSKTAIGDTFTTSLKQLALLTASQTYSSTSKGAGSQHGIIDGASKYKFTYFPKNTTGGYRQTIVNGSYNCKVGTGSGGYYGNCDFYNCTAITIANFVNKYADVAVNIYDCTPGKYITRFEDKASLLGSINYYSGEKYATSVFTTSTNPMPGLFRIYGGSWTTKPDSANIASELQDTHEFCQHSDGYWHLDPKVKCMVVDGVDYTDLSAAVAAVNSALSAKASVKLEMAKSVTIDAPFTVLAGKTFEIELAGCRITASNGLVVNNGTFVIGDKYAGLSGEGGSVVTASGDWLVNNGTASVTYGYYAGNVAMNGGTFTTHHGYFNGALSGSAEYADLRGGYFTQNVTALLKDGYLQTDGYVGQFPKASVSKTFADGYWKYAISMLPSADLALYTSTAISKGDANWNRRAEIKSMVQPYLAKYTIDYTISFDRAVVNGSVTAKITKPSLGDQNIDSDVAAGGLYRILSPIFANPPSDNPLLKKANQKQYMDCLSDSMYQEIEFGVVANADGNYGTTANLRIDLCTGANGTDVSKLVSRMNVASEYTVMGATNLAHQAMIQPASGKAAFYATVAEAIAACPEGDTVKLCNDVAATDAITVTKPCVVDMNGMDFAGMLVAGEGLAMFVSETRPSVEKHLDKNHKVYTFRTKRPFVFEIAKTEI